MTAPTSTTSSIMSSSSRRNPNVSNECVIFIVNEGNKVRSEGEDTDGESLLGNIRTVLKNIRLTVNRLHVRFEEDYFSNGEERQWEPFSIGVVFDIIEVETTDCMWQF